MGGQRRPTSSLRYYSVCFPGKLTGLDFTFDSEIHLKLFLYVVWGRGLSYGLLRVPHPLLKRLSFPQLNCLDTFPCLSMCVGLLQCCFNSETVNCLSHLMSCLDYMSLSYHYINENTGQKKEKSNPGSWTRGLTWPSCSALKPAPVCPCPHASGSPTFLAFCEGWTGACRAPQAGPFFPVCPWPRGRWEERQAWGRALARHPGVSQIESRCFTRK